MSDESDIETEARVTTVAALQAHVGRDLGVGDWLTITQERINAFADATGDRQWIHVDPERCRAAGIGGTIAHGYLTLSLITLLRQSLRGMRIELDARMGINYGSDRVRFITPVRTGARIRVPVRLLALDQVAPAIWQAKYRHTIEIKDEARPALVAETLNVTRAVLSFKRIVPSGADLAVNGILVVEIGASLYMPEMTESALTPRSTMSDLTFAGMKQGKAAQQIADRVRDAVLTGELQVGDRLPPERELIRLSGYSRAVVREGLRILEADGLIVLHAGRNGGAVIERPNADRFASTLDVLLGFESIGAKEVSEVLSMFETRIVELAVDRISAHDIADLRRTITRIEEDPTDVERVRIESNRFHILLAEATRNRMLSLLARVIRQVVIRMEHESHGGTSALQIARAHQRILEAIIAKDVETAKRRALRHLNACGDSMSEDAKGGPVPLAGRNSRMAQALARTPRRRNDS